MDTASDYVGMWGWEWWTNPEKAARYSLLGGIGFVVTSLGVAAIGWILGSDPLDWNERWSPPDTAATRTVEDSAAFLDALRAIDPNIVGDEQEALQRTRNVCSVLPGSSDLEIAEVIQQQFSGGASVVDLGTARRILAVIREHKVCGWQDTRRPS